MAQELWWSKNATISLCEMVERHRNLWDPRDEHYNKHKLRQKVFTDLAQELKILFPVMSSLTGELVRLKFKKLKTYFLRELKKIQTTASGSGGKQSPKWEFYDFLIYLADAAEVTASQPSWPGPTILKTVCAEQAETCREEEPNIPALKTLEISCDDTFYTEPLMGSPEHVEDEGCSSARWPSTPMSPSSPLASPLHPCAAAPQPGLPAVQLRPLGLSPNRQTKAKQKGKQYDQAIDFALKMASKENVPPTYSSSVALVIQTLLDSCSEEDRKTAGIRIMHAAHDICNEVSRKTN